VIARPSQYEKIQLQSDERVLDDLPGADVGVPPISLLYSGFGQFLDIFYGDLGNNSEALADIDAVKLDKSVDAFASRMCEFFANEDARREEGLRLLNDIFAARTKERLPKLDAGPIVSVGTQDRYTADNNIIACIAEFKNSIVGISSLPHVEIVSYFAHSQKSHRTPVFGGWRLPCLGITVVGMQLSKLVVMLTFSHIVTQVRMSISSRCLRLATGNVLFTSHQGSLAFPQPGMDAIVSHSPPHSLQHWFYKPAFSKIFTVE